MIQVQNFTEIPKSDYSLGLRTLFIVPLVLVSLVLFPSWGETLTVDELVDDEKDTVIGITPTPRGKKLPHNQTIPQSLILRDCVAGQHRCLFPLRLNRPKSALEWQVGWAQEADQHQEQ